MSEPRPSWMPLWGEIDAACEIGKDRRVTVDRLLLATGLRAQVEALEAAYVEDGNLPPVSTADKPTPIVVDGRDIGTRINEIRARLAELEGA